MHIAKAKTDVCRSSVESAPGRIGFRLTAILLLASLAIGSAAQTTSDPAAGRVIGTGVLTCFVEDMDRSLDFYYVAFGFDVPPAPDSGSRPYNPSNAQLFAMFDIHGARERHQSAQLPGTQLRLEFMEIQDVPHQTVAMRLQDPGTMMLVFTVVDIDLMLSRSTGAGARLISPGGVVAMPDGSLAVIVQDPDGRYIELRGTSTGAGPGFSDLRPSIAVADLAATVAAYRDVLGFDVEYLDTAPPFTQLRALTGLANATFRQARIRAPGSTLWIELVEYGGVDRIPLAMHIQDRGAARLQIRAQNLEPLVASMSQGGFVVHSEGGGPVPIPPNFMGALVADPNNFFLTPFAPCDGCAPGLVSE